MRMKITNSHSLDANDELDGAFHTAFHVVQDDVLVGVTPAMSGWVHQTQTNIAMASAVARAGCGNAS